MEKFKSISYKYNSRTKRYTIYIDNALVLNKAISKLIGKSGANIIMTKLTKVSFDIYEFFLLELEYCLNLMRTDEHLIAIEVGGVVLKDILDFINSRTWVSERSPKNIDKLFDFKRLEETMNYMPMEHQYDMFKKYEEIKILSNLRGSMLHADPGTGKALRNGTPVLTPKGWVNIEELKVGDYVIGDDGKRTKVTGVYPQGVRKLVELRTQDGRTIPCDLDHLWKYKSSFSKIDNWKVSKTSDIIQLLDKRATISIPRCNRIGIYKLKEPYVIPPYVLGVLLASPYDYDNGNIVTNRFITNDAGIIDNVNDELPDDYYCLVRKNTNGYICTIRKKNSNVNHIVKELKRLNLYKVNVKDTYIPINYIETNVKHRYNLLQGVLDSIGVVDVDYTIRVTGLNISILESLQSISWSLGDICSITSKVPRFSFCSIIDNNILSIVTNNNERYFRLEDKLSKLGKKHHELNLKITSYRYIEDEEATCISVNNKSKLFITKDYIVTHNTYTSLAISELLDYDLVIIIAPKNTIIDPWYNSVTETLYKKPQSVNIFNSNSAIYDNEKFILTHYEFLPKLMKDKKLVRKIKRIKPMLIIDEFHNFNEIKSQRATNLLEFTNYMKFNDILLLTGTPIKMNLKELVPMLYVLDTKFPKVKEMFISLYTGLNGRKIEMLQYRFNLYREHVSNNKNKGRIDIVDYKVSVPNSDRFLLNNINDSMRAYRVSRLAELLKEIDMYKERFETLLDLSMINVKNRKRYKFLINVIRNKSDIGKLYEVYDKVNEARGIELEYILPNLKGNDKKEFRHIASILKYPKLKVMGEALGKILLGTRIECYNELAKHINYKKLLLLTNKKGLVFSNYISVCETVIDTVIKEGFKPIGVYGDLVKELDVRVKEFNDLSNDTSPIVATFKSLSTGTPLPSANVVIILDSPLRSYILTQAISRAYRLGNEEEVLVFLIKLDTGNDFNITDRDLYIINTSENNVEMITGNKPMYDIPKQKTQDELSEGFMDEIEEVIEDTVYSSFSIDYDLTEFISSFMKKIKIV